jgi:hypothetical protein
MNIDKRLSALLHEMKALTRDVDSLAAQHVRTRGRHAYYATLTNYLVEASNGMLLLGIVPMAAVSEPQKTTTVKSK